MVQSVEMFLDHHGPVGLQLHLLLQNCKPGAALPDFPDWVHIHQIDHQISISAARNRLVDPLLAHNGIQAETLVLFPDDDAWYPAGSLEHIASLFTNVRDLDLWFCRYGSAARYSRPKDEKPSFQDVLSYASSNTIAVRGRILLETGGFDERLGLGTPARGGEDTEFAIRAHFASRKTLFADAKLIGHRDPSPEFRSRYYLGGLAAIRRYARKSLSARAAFLRKLAVGAAFVLLRRHTLADFSGAIKQSSALASPDTHNHRPTALRTNVKVRRIVIIVENLPLPFDRRVWQEAQALVAEGWRVSVICPRSDRYPQPFQDLDGVSIYRHYLPLEASGTWGFILEYSFALLHELRLLTKIAAGRGFDVIQACNPPDLLFLPSIPFKLFGKRFVFDHHDSAPALYLIKFGRKDFIYSILRWAERVTFRWSDHVITCNESYRQHALEYGGRDPSDVTTVYSLPDTKRIRRVKPDLALRGSARIVLGYLGVIADQDGVDQLVHMVAELVKLDKADGVKAIVIGDGPALASVQQLSIDLGIEDYITFTGYMSGDSLLAALSTFDIGIIPDPVNAYNDKISMNKVFEYSVLGIPSIAYDLHETRQLLGDTAVYAEHPMPDSLAYACLELIENNARREQSGRQAKALADAKFDWNSEAKRYVAVFDTLLPR
jgi:glycosyltransferase involved in cell wall biosynthesis